MTKTFTHPNPQIHRFTQVILAAGLALLVIAAPLQVVFGVVVPGGWLFILTGITSLLLALPLMMAVSVYPAVTVNPDGLTLHPSIWREHLVKWDEITAVKDYPLLPSQDMEANRRLAVGRKRYKAAQGVMLVIPSLPFPYRAAGWFAGEGFTGIIALTNRTHRDYETLVDEIWTHVPKD